jgi:hypothetical protein
MRLAVIDHRGRITHDLAVDICLTCRALVPVNHLAAHWETHGDIGTPIYDGLAR